MSGRPRRPHRERGGGTPGRGSRIGRVLLRLYSPTFRRDHGPAALDVLNADLRDAAARGGVGGAVERLRLLGEFAAHGPADRLARAFRLVSGADGFWHGWGQDLRHAARSAGRRLGFTSVAVLSVGVGVGANAVVFTLVDTFFLRDIPGVDDPDRLVEMNLIMPNGRPAGWNAPDFFDVAAGVAGLESAALTERGTVSLADEGSGDRLLTLFVTSGYFRTVGVDLLVGRPFPEAADREPGAHPLVILSHRTWQERLGGASDVVGRTLRLNRTPYTVVGVVPADYKGHEFGVQPDVYLPLGAYPPLLAAPERFLESRSTLWSRALGRMSPDVELEAVRSSLRGVMGRLAEAFPESNAGRSATAAPAALFPAEGRAPASIAFGLIMALMLLVLAASSANVGGMLLARATARQREMAIRRALGSGRARVVRHLLTEAMAIFLLGGVLGVVVAVQGLGWFQISSALPTEFPVRLEFALDGRVVAFGFGLTVAAGLLFGLIPALAATRGDVVPGLRDGGGEGSRTSRMRRAFVAGQVGVSIMLLAGAALFLRSLQATGELDPGIDPDGVYLVGFDLALEGYDDPDEALVMIERVLEGVRALPDVAGATVAGDYPLDGGSSSAPVWPGGRVSETDGFIQSYYASVGRDFFETLGIGLVAGRTFSGDDGRTTPAVAIVDRVLAEQAWPGESALGRVVEFGLDPRQYEVVGVVEHTPADMVTDRPAPHVFTFLHQTLEDDLEVAVRQRGDAPDFMQRVRREILAVDPALALSNPRAWSDLVALGTLPQRIVASVAGVLGALALFLAALGVYGVIAFTVARRTREIGVRMALGSSRRSVLGRVLADGLRLALPGFVVGVPLAMVLTGLMRGLLVGVTPVDPVTYLAVAGLFVLVVGAASLGPARRASAVAPADALRSEEASGRPGGRGRAPAARPTLTLPIHPTGGPRPCLRSVPPSPRSSADARPSRP